MSWLFITLGLLFGQAVFGGEVSLASNQKTNQKDNESSSQRVIQETIEVANIPLPPSAVHREALMEDMPYTSLSLSKTGDAWLAGKNHLWKWNPDKGVLKKIEIPSEGFGRVISVGLDAVIYQSSKKVYLILDQPLSIKEIFKGPKVALDMSPDDSIILGSKQSQMISPDLLKKSPLSLDLSPCDEISLAMLGKVFCRIQSEVLLASKDLVKMKSILKSKSPIKDFIAFGDSLVVVSEKVVWLVGPDGRLLKTIVPENGRRIAASHLNREQHTFLFSDRLFEINPMDGKSKLITWISAPTAKAVDDLWYNSGRIGMILDGFPYLFQIEKSPR
jgi:hypothetical protein